MYKEIKIGEKTVPMLANSATPHRYKQAFGEDLIQIFSESDSLGLGNYIGIMNRLGYLMAMQAIASTAGKDILDKVSEEGFLDWMEGFEPGEVNAVSADILKLYNGQKKTTSEAKKKDVQPNAK